MGTHSDVCVCVCVSIGTRGRCRTQERRKVHDRLSGQSHLNIYDCPCPVCVSNRLPPQSSQLRAHTFSRAGCKLSFGSAQTVRVYPKEQMNNNNLFVLLFKLVCTKDTHAHAHTHTRRLARTNIHISHPNKYIVRGG